METIVKLEDLNVSSYLASVITRRECGPDLPDLIFQTQKLDIRVFMVTFQFTSYTKTSAVGNTAPENQMWLCGLVLIPISRCLAPRAP